MKIVYFAWMREYIGTSSEELELPTEIKNVGMLADYLKDKVKGMQKH